MSEPEVRRLRDLLSEVGRRFGFPGAAETGIVWQRWREIVGDAIAEHAEPTSLREGVLRVRTDSPAWAQELSYLARQVVTRANEVAGRRVVTELKVWTGPGKIERARPTRASSSAPDAARPSYGSPQEAFEAARAAWLKRRGGGR